MNDCNESARVRIWQKFASDRIPPYTLIESSWSTDSR